MTLQAFYYAAFCLILVFSHFLRISSFFSDTSFLEFCLKQSRSQAEMLLKENLGSYDRDHGFMTSFLNDFLSCDVLEMAFRSQDYQKFSRDTNHVHDGAP